MAWLFKIRFTAHHTTGLSGGVELEHMCGPFHAKKKESVPVIYEGIQVAKDLVKDIDTLQKKTFGFCPAGNQITPECHGSQ